MSPLGADSVLPNHANLVRFTSDNDQTGDIERVAAIVFTGIQKPAQERL